MKRQCSDDEADLLDAADDAEREEELTEAEAEREAWFAELKAELEQVHGPARRRTTSPTTGSPKRRAIRC